MPLPALPAPLWRLKTHQSLKRYCWKHKYVITLLTIIILHFLFRTIIPRYRLRTSITYRVEKSKYIYTPPGNTRRANATFVILARNSEIDGVVSSMKHVEGRFNKRHRYPYVFLNEVEFSDEFKRRATEATTAPVEFGLIPPEHWNPPSWINETLAAENRKVLESQGIPYADNVPYRNMCRFNSGFFFRHPLLQKYRWYWRVEPNIQHHCDILYDPFLFLQDNQKVYGFTESVKEWTETIPTLWDTVKNFAEENPSYVNENNALYFMSKDRGATYNACHFWSNFEIADLDFFRSNVYMEFFEYLDRTGGFYYERWGDAPVHTMALALFLDKKQLHFFEEIAYQHDQWVNCPMDNTMYQRGNCDCDQRKSLVYDGWSCTSRWEKTIF